VRDPSPDNGLDTERAEIELDSSEGNFFVVERGLCLAWDLARGLIAHDVPED
jgi:hypothetical protein